MEHPSSCPTVTTVTYVDPNDDDNDINKVPYIEDHQIEPIFCECCGVDVSLFAMIPPLLLFLFPKRYPQCNTNGQQQQQQKHTTHTHMTSFYATFVTIIVTDIIYSCT
ncbi:hypothetical protein AB4K20DRAFT_1990213 [Rhizopus microsporus]